MTETTTVAPVTGAYYPGTFVWHEFSATNVEAAEKFYTELFGWNFKQAPIEGMVYRLIHAGDQQIAGMYQADPEMGLPGHWKCYVSVNDVDAAANAAKQAGGTVVYGPEDIPNIGRFAAIVDPQGAAISVYRDNKGDPDTTGVPAVGTICWDTLVTNDLQAAGAFYNKVVGWTTDEAPMGTAFKMGESMEANAVQSPEGVPAHWAPYVLVADLAASRQKAVSLGATVIEEQIDIPYGSLSVIQDPQDGVFCLFVGKDME